MIWQRIILSVGAITVISSCVIVFTNLLRGGGYDVDYRSPRHKPKP